MLFHVYCVYEMLSEVYNNLPYVAVYPEVEIWRFYSQAFSKERFSLCDYLQFPLNKKFEDSCSVVYTWT